MIGSTYLNKHNGKTIEIEDKIVTDTGNILYYGVDISNGHGDYYTARNLEDHWIGNAEGESREMTTKEIEIQYLAEFYQWMIEKDVDICKEFDDHIRRSSFRLWDDTRGFSDIGKGV
tara:strand:+ start:235 stop:585 length:351 start_codon:yes stop_codon:yes gene_type:complete